MLHKCSLYKNRKDTLGPVNLKVWLKKLGQMPLEMYLLCALYFLAPIWILNVPRWEIKYYNLPNYCIKAREQYLVIFG